MPRNNVSDDKLLSGGPFDEAMKRSNVEGDEFDLRKFKPSKYGFRSGALPTEIFVSNSNCCPLVHIDFPETEIRKDFNFALYADGACLRNGTPSARASVGVYGTPDAWYNEGVLLPRHLPQTNQSAEIYSAISAIKIAREILEKTRPDLGTCGCASVVVLAMDSSHVVNAMTDWIRKWRDNGFRNARGVPVANAEAHKRLDHDIRQAFRDRFLVVRFWQIPRTFNFGADKMAAQAFERGRFLDLSSSYLHSDADSDESEARSEISDAFCGLAIADHF